MRVTNVGQYGYALNVATSPPSLLAAQAHLGEAWTTARSRLHGWNPRGALTPISRFATMFSGMGINGIDGTEWYFPHRLTDDTGAVDNGNPSARRRCSMLMRRWVTACRNSADLRIRRALGGRAVLLDAERLARQSRIPTRNLTLIDRHRTYAHNDPAGAYPTNVFFARLLPFLKSVAAT